MGFLTSLSVDVESSEAFKEARKGYLVGATMSTLCLFGSVGTALMQASPLRIPIMALHTVGTRLCRLFLGCHHFAVHRDEASDLGQPPLP
jgi:hypothetical protein